MGFFRRLFGSKKPTLSSPISGDNHRKKSKRWSFAKSVNESKARNNSPTPSHSNAIGTTSSSSYVETLDANKHAIAVAAATAAVAEAALAAAHAAAEVVRLTSGGSVTASQVSIRERPAHFSLRAQLAEEMAAVRIQSAFRGYLARRALRALKALVKLQALVRGHIVRKKTTDMLRRMQTLVRVQTRARSTRARSSESLHFPTFTKSSVSRLRRCGSNANFRYITDLDKSQHGSNCLCRLSEENFSNNRRDIKTEDDKTDKILEVDTWKPHYKSKQIDKTYQTSQHVSASDMYMSFDSPSKFSSKALKPVPSPSSGETSSLSSLIFPARRDEAENSPQVNSSSSRPGSSSRTGLFTPTRSECSWGFFSNYSSYPNYMANTESSKAKVRSQSAPRQRLEFEKYGSSQRSLQASWDARS